jgi:hypothetical protein
MQQTLDESARLNLDGLKWAYHLPRIYDHGKKDDGVTDQLMLFSTCQLG